MSTLFISHSSKDNDAAEAVKRWLAEEPRSQRSVFLDFDDEGGIPGGQRWEQTLYRMLRACRALIALHTDASVESQWCFAEVAFARMQGKPVIGLEMPGLSRGELPEILSDTQRIDMRLDSDAGYRQLWKALEELDLFRAGDWHPKKCPYLALEPYREEHAPVFFGRDEESRDGARLLQRGAPNLIMVLGSSGSGKSSLVRAGIVPRLRGDRSRWLIVDPFRPRRDPSAELAGKLAAAFDRYAKRRDGGGWSEQAIRERLEPGSSAAEGDDAGHATRAAVERTGDTSAEPRERRSGADARLERLLDQLDELRRNPPGDADPEFRRFLDRGVERLRGLCDPAPRAPIPAPAAPGDQPLLEIADELRRASGHEEARVLVVIDQFEELLGHEDKTDDNREARERKEACRRFLELLTGAIEAEDTPLTVVGTMRSDFLGFFQREPVLRGIDYEDLPVGPMDRAAIRQVVLGPERRGWVELDPELKDKLLAIEEAADLLPLLSYTLWRLWHKAENGRAGGGGQAVPRTLSARTYGELGELGGVLASEAERILRSTPHREDQVRAAFVAMARLTEEDTWARRPVSRADKKLTEVERVLKEFEESRLIVPKGDSLEVAHEALFRKWERLSDWLELHRRDKLLERQLARDAEAWKRAGKKDELLWRGGRLQEARELLRPRRRRSPTSGGARTVAGSSLEQEFVHAGIRRRTLNRLAAATLALAILGVLGWFWVEDRRRQLQRRDDLAVSHWEAGRRARESGETVRALHRMALAASIAASERLAAGIVIDASADLQRLRRMVVIEEGARVGAVSSPDADRVLTWSGKTAHLWDCATGQQLGESMEHEAPIWGARFSRDNSRLLTWSTNGVARLWDSETRALGEPLKHTEDRYQRINGAEFTRDSSRVLTWSENTARLWDGDTGDELRAMEHADHVQDGKRRLVVYVEATFFAEDARVLTWGSDHTARLWDRTTGELRLEHDAPVSGARLSRDESRVLTWSEDGSARLWDISTATNQEGDPRPPLAVMKHEEAVDGAIFGRDDRRVLTWSEDGTTRLWDISSDQEGDPGPPLAVMKHEEAVDGAVFGRDDRRVLTWSRDGTARLWTSDNGQQLGKSMEHEKRVLGAKFGRDGRWVLTWSNDGTARVWSGETGEPQGPWMAHREGKRVLGASFDRDESRVLTWSEDGTARLWDATTGRQLGASMAHGGRVEGALVCQGGRVLTWSADRTARLWDQETGERPPAKMEHEEKVLGASFSRDGRRVLTWGGDTARLWNTENPEDWTPMEHPPNRYGTPPVWGAVFNRDESLVLTWSGDGTARLWNTKTGQQSASMGHDGSNVLGAEFSPDESRVLTLSDDRTSTSGRAPVGARLWNWRGTPRRVTLLGERDWRVKEATFSRDGSRVLTRGEDQDGVGIAQLWDREGRRWGETMRHEGGTLFGAELSQDGSRVLTWGTITVERPGGDPGEPLADEHGIARLWDGNGEPRGETMKHEGGTIGGATLSEDGSRVLTWGTITVERPGGDPGEPLADEHGIARLWDGNGEPRGETMKHEGGGIGGATLSQDGSRVLTRGRIRVEEPGSDPPYRLPTIARLWDGRGKQLPSMSHPGNVAVAEFSRDGSRVLTWGGSSAQLWDSDTGEAVAERMVHPDEKIGGARFGPDNRLVVTWGRGERGGGTTRLWDGGTGKQLRSLEYMWPAGAVLSPDGGRLLAWQDHGTMWLLELGADLDFPREKWPLAVRVLTQTDLNAVSKRLERYRPQADEIAEYLEIAGRHLHCRYPRAGLLRRFHPERIDLTEVAR